MSRAGRRGDARRTENVRLTTEKEDHRTTTKNAETTETTKKTTEERTQKTADSSVPAHASDSLPDARDLTVDQIRVVFSVALRNRKTTEGYEVDLSSDPPQYSFFEYGPLDKKGFITLLTQRRAKLQELMRALPREELLTELAKE